MTINGIDISYWGAKQLTVEIYAPDDGCLSDWAEGALLPRSWTATQKFAKLEVKVLFRGAGRDEIIRAAGAMLMPLCRRAVLTLDGYDGEFIAFYTGSAAPEKVNGTAERYTMTMTFNCYRRDTARVFSASGGSAIELFGEGARPAPAVLEIAATADIADLTVSGLPGGDIVISELTAGETIIIDGEEGTATVGGVNAFSRVELWQFPFIAAGVSAKMTFTAPEAGEQVPITATLRYHPMLLM